MKKKIGLFGGSFDPVHMAHLIMASIVKDEYNLEKVIFIPNYVSPFKIFSNTSSIESRIEMLKLAVSEDENFEISDYEATKSRAVYTYETLEYFLKLYPEYTINIIMGYDSYKSLNNWKNSDFIKNNADIIVVNRPDQKTKENEDSDSVFISKYCPQLGISSSIIRQMVSDKLNIKYLVNERVRHYIVEKRMYLN